MTRAPVTVLADRPQADPALHDMAGSAALQGPARRRPSSRNASPPPTGSRSARPSRSRAWAIRGVHGHDRRDPAGQRAALRRRRADRGHHDQRGPRRLRADRHQPDRRRPRSGRRRGGGDRRHRAHAHDRALRPDRAGRPGRQPASLDRRVPGRSTSLLAAVALFVGAFLIFNTLSMTVTERIREVGLLRAAGATRRPGGRVRARPGARARHRRARASGSRSGSAWPAVMVAYVRSIASVPIDGLSVPLVGILLAVVRRASP